MSVTPLFKSPPSPPTNLVTGLGNTFPPKNITNTAEALLSSSGISLNGSLTAALQSQTATQSPTTVNPNSSLAAAINPGVTLPVSTQLQVTDFVNASQNAFPTSAPATSTPSAPASPDNSPSAQNAGAAAPANTNDSSSSAPSTPAPDIGASAGVYSAVASANTSTIRGSGLDVSA